MSFVVDRASHTYELDGKRLVSVTDALSLIENFDGIPAAKLEAARYRGEAVHAAINRFNRENVFTLLPEETGYGHLVAWTRFLDETGAVVIASEQAMWHAKLRYAGTPDCVLSWGRRIVVPDVKATYAVPATVGPQCAAYAELYYDRYHKRPDRYCVHLRADGSYELHPRKDPNDFSIFLSCLNLYRWLEKHS